MAAGTLGFKPSVADLAIGAMFRCAGYAAFIGPVGGYFIQMHTGEPGTLGTANVANLGRRVAAGSGAVGTHWTPGAGVNLGTVTNAQIITFAAVNVPGGGTQAYTHYSSWDASGVGAGNFMFDGLMSGTATHLQDFIIDIGGLVMSFLVDD